LARHPTIAFLSSGCRASEQLEQGLIPLLSTAAAGPPPDGLCLLKHLWDGGAGKDVMELLEEKRAPIRSLRLQ
jgi:hypothetical protein